MSNTDRSESRRTAQLYCQPCRPSRFPPPNRWSEYPAKKDIDIDCNRIIDVSGITFCDGTYINSGIYPSPTTWSEYPATQTVDASCNRLIDVSSIAFCDGTYIGSANSFDISSSQVLVLSGTADISGSYNGASIVSSDRIYQQLDASSSWNTVNGYYAISEDIAPGVSVATAEKLISSWSPATIVGGAVVYYTGVCYSPELNRFVTTGGLTTGVHNRVNISSDGINWNPVTLDASFNLAWRNVIWCPQKNLFVAVGSGARVGATVGTLYFPKVMTSPDGITWTRYDSADNTTSWESLTYSPELDLFVAVAVNTDVSGSGVGSVNRVMTSKNGQIWTLRAAPVAQVWTTVIWAKELGLFIACSSDGTQQIMTSPNGIDWTLRNTPAPTRTFRELAYSPQLGIAIAFNQSNGDIIVSNDGITWTLQTTPLSSKVYNAIAACWANSLNMFLAINSVGPSGTAPDVSCADIMWSNDGRSWDSLRIFNNVDTRFRQVVYSDELGVFVGVSSTVPTGSPRIIYSFLKGRPPTSYNFFDSSFNRIDQSGNWTIQQVLKAGTYTDSSGTPNVEGIQLLYITNPSATTITNFTGGVANQTLTLVFAGALPNTTIANNSNIILKGTSGTNFTPTRYSTLTLLYTGTVWIELRRSVNS